MFRFLVLGLVLLWGDSSVAQVRCTYTKLLKVAESYDFFNPGYPSNYARNLACSWTITAPVGNNILVNCPDFKVPSTVNCTGDVLTLNEKKFCSTGQVAAKTKSNTLMAKFKSVSNLGKFFCNTNTVPDPCSCGRRKTNRIVGGQETLINEFPYQAYIKNSEGTVCSATIISNEYVMTAAHCLTGRNKDSIQVVVGDHDVSTGTETNSTVVHTVKEIIIHENYDGANKNDIGLIRLNKPIEYNEDVGPVCLPWKFRSDLLESKPVTVAGWGTTEFGGPKSKTLQKVDLQTTTMARCKADYPTADDTMICTYAEDKDSCQGDSGGSVYYTDSGRVYSIGVVSGGSGCGGSQAGLNTRVSSQLDWIKANTVGAQFCKI